MDLSSGSDNLLRRSRPRRQGPQADQGRRQQHDKIPGDRAQIPGRSRASGDVGRGCVLAVGPGGVVARVAPALLGVDGEAVARGGAVLVGEAVTLKRRAELAIAIGLSCTLSSC